MAAEKTDGQKTSEWQLAKVGGAAGAVAMAGAVVAMLADYLDGAHLALVLCAGMLSGALAYVGYAISRGLAKKG